MKCSVFKSPVDVCKLTGTKTARMKSLEVFECVSVSRCVYVCQHEYFRARTLSDGNRATPEQGHPALQGVRERQREGDMFDHTEKSILIFSLPLSLSHTHTFAIKSEVCAGYEVPLQERQQSKISQRSRVRSVVPPETVIWAKP